MKLRQVKITICAACLDGEGGECHTPGCAFWLHEMEKLPVAPELYEVIAEFDEPTPAHSDEVRHD